MMVYHQLFINVLHKSSKMKRIITWQDTVVQP